MSIFPGVTESRASESAGDSSASALPLGRAIREMAVQDWLVLGYHAIVVFAVAVGEDVPEKPSAIIDAAGLFAFFALTVYLVRGGVLKNARAAGLLYRFSVVFGAEATYFFFRKLLPIINPRALDAELLRIDLRWFGFEPAFVMERLVTPATSEWFSFVYWFYFFVISAHIVPMVWGSKRRDALNEFTLSALLVFCIGHLVYFVVPGFGPGVAMADRFSVPFPDGFFYRTMLRTVETGGAQKDIFPSIHTAIPTLLTLWSWGQRKHTPWKWTWPFMAFFAANVIFATMFLRWHYLIDVVAGFLLAIAAFWIARRVVPRELAQREEAGLPPVWPEFRYFSKT